MAQSAKVLSVQALKDFRLSMINFVEESRNALSGVDMELKRMRDWLERDQLGYWQMQVKRRHEAMMMARTELHRPGAARACTITGPRSRHIQGGDPHELYLGDPAAVADHRSEA